MKTRSVSAVISAAVLFSALLACKTSEEDVKKLETIKTDACACTDLRDPLDSSMGFDA